MANPTPHSTTTVSFLLVPLLAALAGCSSEPAAKPPAAPPDKIQGRAQIVGTEATALDVSMNAGGPSVYLIDGVKRYRLFLKTPFEIKAGQHYTAEGVYAQKAIDAIGDPDQGKNGYPLEASCDQVVRSAWPGLPFEAADSYTKSLLAKIKRYPARGVFLVTKIEPAADSAKGKEDEGDQEEPKVSVPADKQKALLVEGPSTLPAPLWEPTGGTARCKVVVDDKGMVSALNSGAQLCETVPWAQFRYKPAVQGGKPIPVSTEVEVHFDPRK